MQSSVELMFHLVKVVKIGVLDDFAFWNWSQLTANCSGWIGCLETNHSTSSFQVLHLCDIRFKTMIKELMFGFQRIATNKQPSLPKTTIVFIGLPVSRTFFALYLKPHPPLSSIPTHIPTISLTKTRKFCFTFSSSGYLFRIFFSSLFRSNSNVQR